MEKRNRLLRISFFKLYLCLSWCLALLRTLCFLSLPLSLSCLSLSLSVSLSLSPHLHLSPFVPFLMSFSLSLLPSYSLSLYNSSLSSSTPMFYFSQFLSYHHQHSVNIPVSPMYVPQADCVITAGTTQARCPGETHICDLVGMSGEGSYFLQKQYLRISFNTRSANHQFSILAIDLSQ